MSLLSHPTPGLARTQDDAWLCTRIHAEFREMPGLKLTLPQAARLFSLDGVRCEQILGALVDEGHLTTDGRTFANAHGGR
jgi:hypothetical protein